VVAGSIKLHGKPLEDDKSYRVVANNFIAEGGDSFPVFAKGSNRVETGIVDLDALNDYLRKNEGVGAPSASLAPSARIVKVR
jgi:5'-nucleotidase